MCHVSHVTCHVSHVTCYLSHVNVFFVCLFFFLQQKFGKSGGASRGRVCYQRGLPRLVTILPGFNIWVNVLKSEAIVYLALQTGLLTV